jgi:hypothetical protein
MTTGDTGEAGDVPPKEADTRTVTRHRDVGLQSSESLIASISFLDLV